MPNSEALRAALLCEIEQAFAGVRRQDGVTLHEADVIDDHGTEEECLAARALDTDERWQDVPDDDIEYYSWILSFLDPKGLRYYLPAYMRWTLRNFRRSDSMSSDHTIYTLAIGRPALNREWSLDRYALFDTAQRRAIARFLSFMADHSAGDADAKAAAEALEDHWGRFLTTDSEPDAAADGTRDARVKSQR